MSVTDLFKRENNTLVDSDVRHIIDGFTSTGSFNRLSFVSDAQIRARVCAIVTEQTYLHPDLYKYLNNQMVLASELLFYFSTSKEGFLVDKVVTSVNSRLAVTDASSIRNSDKNELE